MNSKEKKLFVMVFIIAWLVAGAVWLITPTVAPGESSQATDHASVSAELTGVPIDSPTPTPRPESYPAQLIVTSVGVNRIRISLRLDEVTTLSGVEASFWVFAAPGVQSFQCGSAFTCPAVTSSKNVVHVSALRPLAKIKEPLSDTVVVAELQFAGGVPSVWEYNGRNTLPSKALNTTSPVSLLTPYQVTLNL